MSVTNLLRSLFALAFALLLFASHASACEEPRGPFFAALAGQSKACTHPLCGRIFSIPTPNSDEAKSSCRDDAALEFETAVNAALSAHGIVILGEAHDSAVHHILQAAAVEEFARRAPKATAVVFEQLRDDQQAGLDRFAEFGANAARRPTVADLKRFIDWDKSGWPKDLYDPLFKAVIDAKLPIFPGDVPRAAIMKTAKEGEASLAAEQRRRLGLDALLGTKLDAASVKDIADAHCGAIPESAFAGMAYAQRYRDAHLAEAALKAADADAAAILITGTAHARTDRGVPWYLRRRAPEKKVVSAMLVEVEVGEPEPETYVPRDPDGKPAADFIIFTPPTARGDPCEKMRKK